MLKVVIDSNILFSALIRNGTNRQLILEFPGELLFSSFIYDEAKKYQHELMAKSGMNPNEFQLLFQFLLQRMTIVDAEKIKPFQKQAKTIVKDIDPNDDVFIACALAHPNSILWSNDKALKRQSIVRVCDTAELLTLLHHTFMEPHAPIHY